jgi:hypothetical protein
VGQARLFRIPVRPSPTDELKRKEDMMTRLVKAALILSFAMLFAATPASSGTIVIDEFLHGLVNGAPITGVLGTDPGPGGLTNLLIYILPFAGVVGDVIMEGPGSDGESDVVRFNGDHTVIFYSDNNDGFDAPADLPHAVRVPQQRNGARDRIGAEQLCNLHTVTGPAWI